MNNSFFFQTVNVTPLEFNIQINIFSPDLKNVNLLNFSIWIFMHVFENILYVCESLHKFLTVIHKIRRKSSVSDAFSSEFHTPVWRASEKVFRCIIDIETHFGALSNTLPAKIVLTKWRLLPDYSGDIYTGIYDVRIHRKRRRIKRRNVRRN